MPAFLESLGELAAQNQLAAYSVLYLATIFVGNIAAFAGFWLVATAPFGTFGIPFFILVVFAGNVSGDFLWYTLGRALRGTRLGNFIKRRIPKKHGQFEEIVQKNGIRWFFFSKLFPGSSPPVVFSLGWAGVLARGVFRISLLSTLLWLPFLLGITYGLFSGLTPLRAVAFLEHDWLLLIGLGLFILVEHLVARLAKKLLGKHGEYLNDKGGDPAAVPATEVDE